MLHAVAAPLETHLRLGRRPALALGGALMVMMLAAAVVFLGPELVTQMRNLFTTLPEAANRLMGYFQLGSMADLIKDGTTASALGGLASRVIAWSTTVAGALASFLLVLFGGIYLAINPRLYRDGLVKLVPPAVQPNVNATLDDAGEALKRWLAGQVDRHAPGRRVHRRRPLARRRAVGLRAGLHCRPGRVRAAHRSHPRGDSGPADCQHPGLADRPAGARRARGRAAGGEQPDRAR